MASIERRANRLPVNFKKLLAGENLVVLGTVVAFGSVGYTSIEGGRINPQARTDFPDQASHEELNEAMSLRERAYRELDQGILTDQTVLEISQIADRDQLKRSLILTQNQEQIEQQRKAFVSEERLGNVLKMLVGTFGGLVLAVAGVAWGRRKK